MARVWAILRALATAYRRDQSSLQTVAGNNFFIVTALLLQSAGAFIYLIIGLVMLFPLSTDPLRKIPASRLAQWPIERGEYAVLRALSPWVNPLSWIIAAVAVWTARGKVTWGLWGLFAGLFALAFVLSDVSWFSTERLWRMVPNFPGRLDQLVRKNLREMLSTLDVYCAAVLSLSTLAWRVSGRPLPSEAFLAVTVLTILALSSYAQCLFGLDGSGGLNRYRLLPVRGWQLIAAKDAAFLLIAIPLTLPLAPLPGISAALVALAMGHDRSVSGYRKQMRWRFSSGSSIMFGIGQAILMATAAAAVFFSSALFAIPCVAAWAGSLFYYGRVIEISDFQK